MAFNYHDDPAWVKYYLAAWALAFVPGLPIAGVVLLILWAAGVL